MENTGNSVEQGSLRFGWLERIKTSFQLNGVNRRINDMRHMTAGKNSAFAFEDSVVELDFNRDGVRITHIWDGEVHFELVEACQEWDGSPMGYSASVFEDGPEDQREYQTYSTARTENSLPVSELAQEVRQASYVVAHGHPVPRADKLA